MLFRSIARLPQRQIAHQACGVACNSRHHRPIVRPDRRSSSTALHQTGLASLCGESTAVHTPTDEQIAQRPRSGGRDGGAAVAFGSFGSTRKLLWLHPSSVQTQAFELFTAATLIVASTRRRPPLAIEPLSGSRMTRPARRPDIVRLATQTATLLVRNAAAISSERSGKRIAHPSCFSYLEQRRALGDDTPRLLDCGVVRSRMTAASNEQQLPSLSKRPRKTASFIID